MAVTLLIAAALSGLLTVALIVLLRPLLVRYALARPNARSSHKTPTPQGGGIALISAAIFVVALTGLFDTIDTGIALPLLLPAAIILAVAGAVDDIRPMGVAPRLFIQVLCVAAAIVSLPSGFRALPDFVPGWLEWAVLLIGLIWFVNLCNFMDGLDWMTVAEMVPLTAALSLFLGPGDGLLAAAIGGGIVGFAFFNKPVARLFLGDVGSLPLGLLAGTLLIFLAGQGHLAAALLLPLYYLADATITLARRAIRGEAVWQAHRSHYYQIATTRGLSVIEIVARVFAVNVVLTLLAWLSIEATDAAGDIGLLVVGAVLVAGLLYDLQRSRHTP